MGRKGEGILSAYWTIRIQFELYISCQMSIGRPWARGKAKIQPISGSCPAPSVDIENGPRRGQAHPRTYRLSTVARFKFEDSRLIAVCEDGGDRGNPPRSRSAAYVVGRQRGGEDQNSKQFGRPTLCPFMLAVGAQGLALYYVRGTGGKSNTNERQRTGISTLTTPR